MKMSMKPVEIDKLNDVIGSDVLVKTKNGDVIAGLANICIDDIFIVSTIANQDPGIEIEFDDIESAYVIDSPQFSTLLKGHYIRIAHKQHDVGLVVKTTNQEITLLTEEGKYIDIDCNDVKGIYVDDASFSFNRKYLKGEVVSVAFRNDFNEIETYDKVKLDEDYDMMGFDKAINANDSEVKIPASQVLSCLRIVR